MGEKLGIVNKGGAWYSYEDYKFQGRLKFANFLREMPDVALDIEGKIFNA